jgi:hypothetical protein
MSNSVLASLAALVAVGFAGCAASAQVRETQAGYEAVHQQSAPADLPDADEPDAR